MIDTINDTKELVDDEKLLEAVKSNKKCGNNLPIWCWSICYGGYGFSI